MKIRVLSYYKEFKCIASACEDTCCAGWDVVIDNETYQSYQNQEGPFGEKLRNKMIVDEDGDNVFILDGIRCPFLNNNNLCDIHKELGEQFLCHTCKQYPRYMDVYGDLKEMGISLSCPEAARIIFAHRGSTEFELIEDNQVNDSHHVDKKEILDKFFKCRETMIQILEKADYPLGIRAAIVLKFVEELQDKLDFGEFDAMNQFIEKYNDGSHINALMNKLNGFKVNETIKYQDITLYFKTFSDLEHINDKDPLGLNRVLETYLKSEEDKAFYRDQAKAFNEYYEEQRDHFKKILVYFVYRYFMKSFFDYDMSSKIKVAMISTIMIKALAVVRWIEKQEFDVADMVVVSQSYSKDIEHLEKNVETLERIFETDEVYTYDRIINTLVNEF